MKKLLGTTPVALAVAAVFGSAYAEGNRHDVSVSVDVDNEAEISLRTSESIRNDFAVVGRGRAVGRMEFDSESSAIVDVKQITDGNWGSNGIVDNDATIGGDTLRSAKGNIGANVAAGDNNQQANDAALSAVDAEFVFASAQNYSVQKSTSNRTNDLATENDARLAGAALAGASGNIGVNVAAGNGNQQANLVSASLNSSGVIAKASTFGLQDAGDNSTSNFGFAGLATGALGFSEAGSVGLAGSFSGSVVNVVPVFRPHENNAHMGGTALSGAEGNIGVNIAAGSHNMQRNSLAIATAGR